MTNDEQANDELPITDYQLPITNYHVNLSIYSITGQLVRTLVNEEQKPGYYSVKWDGKDDKGREVCSGLYIYTIKAGEFNSKKRMVIVK